jgi:hypothetical protein
MAARPRTSAERELDAIDKGTAVRLVHGPCVWEGTVIATCLYEFPDKPKITSWTVYTVKTRYSTYEDIYRRDLFRVTPVERGELLDRLRADLDAIQGEINALIDAEPEGE